MSDTPIKAVFTYSRDEYIRAMRRHYRSKIHVYRDLILGALMVAMGGVMMYYSPPNLFFSWLIITLGLILLLMVVYAVMILPALIYRSDPKLKCEYELDFYNDRIEFRTTGIDSTLQWQIYQSWVRDDEFYILYHGKRDVSVIPRRVLESDDSDQRFAELLQRKIGR